MHAFVYIACQVIKKILFFLLHFKLKNKNNLLLNVKKMNER